MIYVQGNGPVIVCRDVVYLIKIALDGYYISGILHSFYTGMVKKFKSKGREVFGVDAPHLNRVLWVVRTEVEVEVEGCLAPGNLLFVPMRSTTI